jgi:hypothetical protein
MRLTTWLDISGDPRAEAAEALEPFRKLIRLQRAMETAGSRATTLTGILGLVLIVGWLAFPVLRPVALVIMIVLGLFAAFSLFMAVLRGLQYERARRAFYGKIPLAERGEVDNAELRTRGAPDWFIRAGHAERAIVLITLLVVLVVLMSPWPGDPYTAGLAFAILAVLIGAKLVHRFATRKYK